jgi:hypothetical protein
MMRERVTVRILKNMEKRTFATGRRTTIVSAIQRM